MRPNLKLTALAALTTFTLVAGCSGGSSGPHTTAPTPGPTTPDTPSGPVEGNPTPAPTPHARYAGVYAVVAPLDLTQNGVLPGVLGPALGALIELHDHPGKAILDIVAIANIPTVSDAVKNMPGFLRDLLSTLLDKLITDELYKNVPVVEHIASIISGVTDLAKTIDLHDSLTVHTPAADGTVAVDQQVTDVGFTLLSKQTVITFNAAEKMMAHDALAGTVKPHANAPVADADLTLGGGSMTLPFGELVLQAAGPLLFGQFGGATDLKGALHNLVPCHAAAKKISDGLGGYLPPALIETMCTAALDVVADTVTSKIDAVVLSNVKISSATAYLLDVSQSKPQVDYQSDRIAQGKWSWSFSVNGSSITVPSTFEGDRTGDAQ